jgi:hypothetical protein
MSQGIEREIDALYQLPLAEFTPARNALAKESKDHRPTIAGLQKPSVPAWAVNQLYWQRRGTYDALIKAAEQVRAAQAAQMEGRRADTGGAETAHAAALKAAAREIRDVLSGAGETASPATMIAVTETLQALPSTEPPGRLIRPLKPLGFEALTRLLAPGPKKGTAAIVLPFQSKTGQPAVVPKAPAESSAEAARRERAEAKRLAEAAKREAQARARDAEKLESELREARSAERAAEAASVRARTAASAAERRHQDLLQRIEASENDVDRLKKEAAAKDRAATDASVARQRIEARLKALG